MIYFFAWIDILKDSCKNLASFESSCKILVRLESAHHEGRKKKNSGNMCRVDAQSTSIAVIIQALCGNNHPTAVETIPEEQLLATPVVPSIFTNQTVLQTDSRIQYVNY